MDEWYKEWFNTEEYLAVYLHRNEEDAKKLVELILSNVNLPEGSKILDMACGTGRHSILFAERNYKVTAVDLSENLLSIARQAAIEADVKINFIHSDLRCFSVNARFNLAVSLFTSFGYFEGDAENFNIFRTAFQHLENGGCFVLDYLNKNYVENNLVPESVIETSTGTIIQRRNIKGNRVIKNIFIKRNGTEKHYHESVRLYGKDELVSEITKTGFEIEKIFGNFSGKSFDLNSSPRIIIIARK